MAAEHLTALFSRAKPDKTVRQIAHEAGMREHQLHYWFKSEPRSRRTRMPNWDTLSQVAFALDVAVWEVARAFAQDAGVDLEPAHTTEEYELLTGWRSLSGEHQQAIKATIEALQRIDE